VTHQRSTVAACRGDREGLDDARDGRFLRSWLALSLLFIMLAAWRSVGHYHSDEQFQTLEFAAAKLGLTPETTLPWEHGLRMRPWLQPGLYVVIVSALRELGLEDPFAWATCLRLVSGLCGWTALVGLALCSRNWLDDLGSRRIAIKLTAVFCLLPVLLVRTSSESLATSSFFLGLALFELGMSDRDRRGGGWLFLTGALFGLAFEFRYPVGLMVAGWFAWATFVRRPPVGDLIRVGMGVVGVISAAALVDRWG
jgi:phosphatidylinositol glycan class B